MSDPTLQAAGALSAVLRLDWNGPMSAAFDGIEYGPANEPGPSWVQGTQYEAIGNNVTINGFGLPTSQGPAGYAGLVQIMDMSPATVLPGKNYGVGVNLQYNWVQLYFLLVGSTAGTTVVPGFGLWNLSSNPNAWSYVTPTAFTGLWQMELLTAGGTSTAGVVAPVLLSVQYAAPKVYLLNEPPTARLVFTVSGGLLNQGIWSPVSAPSDAQRSSQSPGRSAPSGLQFINRSTPLAVRNKAGAVQDGG